jgi:ABC-type multidrug transport system fused ATPase/permease subunit
MQTFKKLLFLLNTHEKKSAGLLLIMIIIMTLLDVIGVASILPFMAVLTNPSLIETNFILNTIYKEFRIFGIQNSQQFTFALGFLLFFILIISLIVKAIITYVQLQFVQLLEHSIGKRLVEAYLHQPYDWFLNRHSADLGKNILSEVGSVVGSGIGKLIELISKGAVTISIVILLIIVNSKLALMVGFSLIVAYVIIFYSVNTYLNRIGKESLKNNRLRFTAIIEAFGAAKEIKVGGLEQAYIKSFSNSSKNYAQNQATSTVVAQLPRFFIEAIAFGGILLVLLYLMKKTGSLNNALPIISLYVFAAYRLIPALQIIYASFTQIIFVGPSLDKLYYDLKNIKPLDSNQDQSILSFNTRISLKNIHYNYPNSSRTALENISLNITAKSTVGLIGATGSGKTTIIDIILGLLEPQKGSLEVDGKIITKKNSRSWQRSIGYVPQHIYLSDDTVAANIAFGVEPKDIDQKCVEKACKIANLHEFVLHELPKKYETAIGERGVRLSGGQRQRIGIARALYHNPKVLVLDEATSALDNKTEKLVMDGLNNLSKDITIIIIAHRLSTVIKCDKIFLLEKGKLKNEGTFEELIKINENFRIKDNT